MQDNNPYSTPSAAVADVAPGGVQELAGRGMRLGAVIIDGMIAAIIMLPMMIMGGYFEGVFQGVQPSAGKQLAWTALSFAVFVVIQGYPLSQSGQTWGKKLLKMRIVDLEGGQPPLASLLAKRFLPMYVFSVIPFVGWIISLADVLFIFGQERRCIHDLIAGTRVVVAD